MKRYSLPLLLLSATLLLASCATTPKPQVPPRPETTQLSTTIDFLDYCFYKTDPKIGYFTEEQYEEVFRELAEAGFDKVYLRVNVCGLSLYPSKVVRQYPGDGRDPGSTYLVNTLAKYDPAAKSVELGHRYGMEVWVWENIFDDEATMVEYSPVGQPELYKKFGRYPLKDHFLITHPEYQWELDPRIQRKQAGLKPEDVSSPITALRLTSDSGHPPRASAKDFQIHVSDDNQNYRLLKQDFTTRVDPQNPHYLLIENLTITEPYLKMVWQRSWPGDKSFTLTGDSKTFGKAYWNNAWHEVTWTWVDNPKRSAQGHLNFRFVGRFAWDFKDRAVGMSRHVPLEPRYFGMAEMGYKAVRQHKLKRLGELKRYAFDGFAFSIRSHSQIPHPENYGYGKPIRDAYLKRYGKDIWIEEFDRQKWLDLRAEFIDQFLADAAKLVAPLPLFMDFPVPGASYRRTYGDLPFHVQQWADSGVAGIRILGGDADQPLLRPWENAPNTQLIRFIDNWSLPKLPVFQKRLGKWLANPNLDEVEYYETVIYTDNKSYLKAVRSVKDKLAKP